nr:pilus assembly protein MshP [Stutzerimonas stutzeri]
MWRISTTQTATSSLALQQARAYQAARAGLEWGIATALSGACSDNNPPFTPGGGTGFRVEVSCKDAEEQEEGKTLFFYTLTSTSQYSEVGSPDYTYRQLQAMVEREKEESDSETGED